VLDELFKALMTDGICAADLDLSALSASEALSVTTETMGITEAHK